MQSIHKDEHNLNPDSRLGDVMIRIARNVVHHGTIETDGLNWLLEPMHSIFANFRSGVSMQIDRESMFRKFHALRLDQTTRNSFLNFLSVCCIEKPETNANLHIFMQIFIEELLNEIVKE